MEENFNEQLEKSLMAAIEAEKYILVSRLLQEIQRRDNLNLQLPISQGIASLQKRVKQVEKVLADHDLIGAQQQQQQDGECTCAWTEQGLTEGKDRNTMAYHRLDDKGQITVRLETPLEPSMLIPLLAILNETDLFTTWLPPIQTPFKLGIQSAEKLKQCSKGSQVARIRVDMPWPMSNREVIIRNAVIDAVDELGVILIQAGSVQNDNENTNTSASTNSDDKQIKGQVIGQDDFKIPPCQQGWERIWMDGALTIRPCPKDHPALKECQFTATTINANKATENDTTEKQKIDNDDSSLLLATFTLFISPSVNFILQFVAPYMWAALLSVAEEVRDGKRPMHVQAIADNPDFYGWVTETVQKVQSLLKE